MKSIFFLYVGLLLSPIFSFAQIQLERQVVSAAGDFEENDGISVSWTLGEVAIQTLSNNTADIILTQGFQQADLIETLPIKEVIEELGLNIFPNPVEQTLNIKLEGNPSETLKVRLSDLNGNLIQEISMNSSNLEVEMGGLPDAMYLLLFSDGEKLYSRKVLKASK